jgi:hypothetical protein
MEIGSSYSGDLRAITSLAQEAILLKDGSKLIDLMENFF